MTSRPLWLSLVFGLAYLTIGIHELLRLGRSIPTSWVTIYDAAGWAWWILPALFVLIGLVALIGGRVPRMAWIGYRLSSTIVGIWGLVGAWSWWNGQGGNVPGTVMMLLFAVTIWMLADYVSEAESKGKIVTLVAAGVEKIGVETIEAAANGG